MNTRVRVRANPGQPGRLLLLTMLAASAPAERAPAQAVVVAWGNVEGLRVEGEVFPFEISLCTVNDAGAVSARTQKEKQQPRFSRAGNVRTIATRLGVFSISETITDVAPREVALDVRFVADSASTMRGVVCIDAPDSKYSTVQLGGSDRGIPSVALNGARGRRLEFTASTTSPISVGKVRREGQDMHRVLIPVIDAPSEAGRSAQITLTVKALGDVDHSPMTLTIDGSTPGRIFEGLGGNFRLQNPRVDPAVIAYNLANLRVAWARVEMPWRTWHPDTLVDPATKDTTQVDPRVRAAMAMARTAKEKGAQVVVSAWFPPQWAVIGALPPGGRWPDGTWGSQLDPAKTERIYDSITSYLLYLKQHFGVEAAMFSFNESDLGINVRQTGQEHADLIKGLGAYMKRKGLSTTMLLGDVSDATPTWFIKEAMADAATHQYIGAVSYHSWRGWSDSLLTFWFDAAKRLGVPLLVGEGSIDAGAHRYPAIFREPELALQEIELYVRMLALSQPMSILQWQLTSDYSVLAGGGVYGDTSALRPTQRFWNLKQLASTPPGIAHLPMTCAAPVRCAALGNAREGTFAAHIVNTGASRSVTLTGIPRGIGSLRIWTTDTGRNMQEGALVAVRGGIAKLVLDGASYTTLIAPGSSR